MQPHTLALVGVPRGLFTGILVALLVSVSASRDAMAQQGAMPQTSSSVADQFTKLLRSITGARAPRKAPEYKRTRFVMELERAAHFEVFSLVNPNRVVLQLPSMRMRLPAVPRQKNSTTPSLVTTIRGGKSGPKLTRIVIGVATPVVVENAYVVPRADGGKAELRLDIVPTEVRSSFATARAGLRIGGSSSLGGSGLQPPVPRKAATLNQRKKRTHKYLIVVDPGHGGHDSGAKKNGIQEKDVVLAFGKMLRDKLAATGHYRVVMTRDTDRFIKLRARREFAERRKADLFISVHADYARSNASGATIYSLRKRVAERLKRSAKRQVSRADLLSRKELNVLKASPASANAGALRKILTDLAWRDVEHTRFQTEQFSQTVIKYMGQSTAMRQRPHQSAAFRVLKTATMPAVLIELAYVSNRRDARRLTSRSWRNKVSGSIVTAVENYFANAQRLPM